MSLYGVALLPLATKMRQQFPTALQPWYADNLGEQPTKTDWVAWESTWYTATTGNLQLMNTLGKWKSPPHFVWPWIYDPDSLLLYVLQANGFRVHEATQIGTRFTRTSTKFKQTSHVVQLALGEYVSVLAISTVNGIVYDWNCL